MYRALLAAVLLTVTLAVPGAPAVAAAGCTGPAGDAFYDPPAALPAGGPGTLISCRQVTVNLGLGSSPHSAWLVTYRSTDAAGTPVAASGIVVVPAAPWTGVGARPVVAFAPGTQGLGNQCALSRQLLTGLEYEAGSVSDAVNAGFAVAATDYQGYLNGQVHTYIVGQAMGNATLDVARSAFQVPGAGLSPDAQVGIWGYSEGGGAAAWAAQRSSSYAPELNVVGTAAGGVPGDLRVTAANLNGGVGAAFLLAAAIGFRTAYPALPFDSLLNGAGRQAVATAKRQCVAEALLTFAFRRIEDYTVDRLTLDQLYRLVGSDGVSWGQRLDSARLTVNVQVHHPVFMFRALADEIIPIETEDATREAFCAAGVPVQWGSYVGDHLTTAFLARGDAVSFLRNRFAGRSPVDNC